MGNITSKTTVIGSAKTGLDYHYGVDSSCGWENLLTSVDTVVYNADGTKTVTKTETIDYDAIGNPLTYRGATLNWYGRQLKTFIKNGTTIAMTYDADGLRSSKTVAGVKTEYQYVGDKLFYEKRGNGNTFYYFYDSYGKLSAIYHHVNGTKTAYHVVTNAQGDVIALYSWAGALVASYEYDAWGNILSVKDANGNAITSQTHIAHLNPFRYRSYYYDKDLGLYYLQSRYYDAEIGRFINADRYISTGMGLMGYNMFAYCNNNPVNMTDDSGNLPKWVLNISKVIKKIFSSNKTKPQVANKSLPYKGDPGSSQTLPNPDGTPKQKRWYGPDGTPERDRDFNHPGNDIPFPHDHEWENGERNPEHLEPSPEYEISIEQVLGVGVVTICTIGMIYIIGNDLTGVGIADDGLIAPLGFVFGKGLSMIIA